MLSLYLHFPFCKRKCFYCDFCSMAAERAEIAVYCAALEKEISLMAGKYAHMAVDTVFIGGGTPSIVPESLMAGVLAAVRNHFTIAEGAEFTSEANPGTLRDGWLNTMVANGMNRLSIGVQAQQEHLLKLLGRMHDFPMALAAFAMAKKHGITNINADAMFGLPKQGVSDYVETLRALADAGATHLSAYALQVEEGTLLAAQVAEGTLRVPNQDETADMLEAGISSLSNLGFERYEISNYARPGFACRHNIGYWTQKHYLGLGVSAASHLPASPDATPAVYTRRQNTHDIKQYMAALAEGVLPPASVTGVAAKEAMFETVMLGLRMVQGLRYADFAALHGQTLQAIYGEAIRKLTNEGLLETPCDNEPRLMLTARGLAVQNTALMAFLQED